MTTPKDHPDMGPIEVITSVQRRRRWSQEEKHAILEEAEQAGNSLSAVARRYGVNPNQLFHWRKLMREGALVAVEADDRVGNMRWYSDVFEIGCWNEERVRVAFSMDCQDREILSYIATTAGLSGEMVRDLMAESIEARFGPVDQLSHRIE